ncbi:MAG: hypothetical protein Q9P14_12670 [candidate division KSB1 bacterium]|nr:hypothetical protein [candidate division KSB1 bacterium]
MTIGFWLFACMGLLAETVTAQRSQTMEHFPVTRAEAGRPVAISVRLQSSSMKPVYVRVYFRQMHEQSYRHVDLRGSMNTYSGRIPEKYVKPPAIQYFVVALYPNQKVVSLPELNPYGRPYEVIVEESAAPPAEEPTTEAPAQPARPVIPDSVQQAMAAIGASEVQLIILSPEPGEVIRADEVVIAASFIGAEDGVDSTTIRITIDGQDMTHHAETSPFIVTMTPPRLLPGDHTVVIWAKDNNGQPLTPVSWTFAVADEGLSSSALDEKSYEGQVFAEYRQERFSGQSLDIKNLGGNIEGTAGPFAYRGLAYWTSLEDPLSQPRSRFSLMVESKMLDFGVGDVYPYFHELAMWGRRVRGFMGALKFGKVNFQVAYGQTVRAIDPDSTQSGAYRQNLLAGRLSFGSGEKFQLGLMAVKGKDATTSVSDPNDLMTTTPKDNLVAGADLLLALDSHRFELKGSVAFSLTTNDITNGPATKALIDSTFNITLPLDPASLKNILVLNESTVPLDPLGMTSLAYQVALNLNYFGHYLQVGFKQIGPDYITFGHTYLRGNIRGLFASDRIGFFNNKVFATLGIEDYKDNFGQEDDNPALTLRTFNVGLAIYPGPYWPNINFSIRNYLRNNGVDSLLTSTLSPGTVDTTDSREKSLTQDVSLNVSYDFSMLNLRHTATLSVISSRLIDQYSSTRPTTYGPQDLVTTVQMLSLKSDFEQPLTTSLTLATNRNESTGGKSVIQFDLVTARADYRMLNDKLTVYGGLNYIKASGQQLSTTLTTLAVVNYTQTGILFGAMYQPNPHHNFMLDVELSNYNDKGKTLDATTGTLVPNQSYKNRVIRLYYEYIL